VDIVCLTMYLMSFCIDPYCLLMNIFHVEIIFYTFLKKLFLNILDACISVMVTYYFKIYYIYIYYLCEMFIQFFFIGSFCLNV